MNNEKRRFDIYLNDILISMLRIEEYIEGKDFNEFKKNYLVVDAVVRNFEIIGEAAKSVPDVIKAKYPEIPWKKMVGLRNTISHEYFGLDYELLWEIAKINLPYNINDMQRIIEEIKK